MIKTNPLIERPRRLSCPERDLLSFLESLERRPPLTIFLLFALSLLGFFIFTAFKGWPLPSLHDEYSYLLSGDTMAHGRFSNPTHPHSDHFETFHVLQKPTYASKYPPLPGAFLALGQLLGHPAIGVFLASSLTIASLYWALRALLSHGWSLVASFLAWAQFAPYSFYSSSYMGGNVSAWGACILLGAVIRLVQSEKPIPRHAILLGIAAFILAGSRPFEGLVTCFGLGLILVGKFLTVPQQTKLSWLGNFFVPASLVFLTVASLILFYNHAVTGNALKLPYSAYESTHSQTPLFVFGTLGTNPLPNTPHLQQFEKEFTQSVYQAEKDKGFFQRFAERFELLLQSFIPFWLPAAFLLLLSATASNRWIWFSWAIVLIFMTASSFTVWFSRHYLGCLLPFLCLLTCSGAQQLCLFHWKNIDWPFQFSAWHFGAFFYFSWFSWQPRLPAGNVRNSFRENV